MSIQLLNLLLAILLLPAAGWLIALGLVLTIRRRPLVLPLQAVRRWSLLPLSAILLLPAAAAGGGLPATLLLLGLPVAAWLLWRPVHGLSCWNVTLDDLQAALGAAGLPAEMDDEERDPRQRRQTFLYLALPTDEATLHVTLQIPFLQARLRLDGPVADSPLPAIAHYLHRRTTRFPTAGLLRLLAGLAAGILGINLLLQTPFPP